MYMYNAIHDTHATYMHHGLRETDKITQAGGDRNTCTRHVIAEDHVLAGAAPIGLWSGVAVCLVTSDQYVMRGGRFVMAWRANFCAREKRLTLQALQTFPCRPGRFLLQATG